MTVTIRSDGVRYHHTSLDIPEHLVLEVRKRGVPLSRIVTAALTKELGLNEEDK